VSVEIRMYVREGCPHCERAMRHLEQCLTSTLPSARLVIIPSLVGAVVRGSRSTPLSMKGIPAGVPQIEVIVRSGSRKVSALLYGGVPPDKGPEETCSRLAELVSNLSLLL